MKTKQRPFLIFVLIFFVLTNLITSCGAPQTQTLQSEKDFQKAFNNACFSGQAKMEVRVKYGKIDLLTDNYAIEVDRVDKFHEAIGQSLHYARETRKKPAVALFLFILPRTAKWQS